MPQNVSGTVAPLPGLVGVPIGAPVEPLPTQVPLASPLRDAATAQTVTGAKTGADPVAVVSVWDGSHELFAVPATATTTLHAFTGMTPSTGALWLPSLVGRSLTSGNPASGMHMPLAEPSTSTTAPQAVTGAEDVGGLTLLGGGVGLLGAVRRAVAVDLGDHVADGDRDVGIDRPRLRRRRRSSPTVLQSLEVLPTRPTLTEQMLTGASALMAPFCDVDAADCPLANPSADAAWLSRPIALSCAVIGALASARPPGWFSPTDVVEQLLLASAARPTESEHALIGASALATGDDCPVLFVPVRGVLTRQHGVAELVRQHRDRRRHGRRQ